MAQEQCGFSSGGHSRVHEWKPQSANLVRKLLPSSALFNCFHPLLCSISTQRSNLPASDMWHAACGTVFGWTSQSHTGPRAQHCNSCMRSRGRIGSCVAITQCVRTGLYGIYELETAGRGRLRVESRGTGLVHAWVEHRITCLEILVTES